MAAASVAAVAIGGGVVVAPTPTGGAPAAPTIVVPIALGSADGVAVDADGAIYATEALRDRVLVREVDGTFEELPFEVDEPRHIAVAPDGSVAVSHVGGIAVLEPGGDVRTIDAIAGASVGGLAFGPDGVLHAVDVDDDVVLRLPEDAAPTTVDIATADDIRGLDVGADGSIYVIDVADRDVVRRAPDGTEADLGFPALVDPSSLDEREERVAVGDGSTVAVRGGGSSGITAPATLPVVDVAIEASNLVLFATPPIPGVSAPGAPGGVFRLTGAPSPERVPFGDVHSFASVAAASAGRAIFTSHQGAKGYSDENPVREASLDGTVVDRTSDGAAGLVAVAPDGTIYRAFQELGTARSALERIAPDGSRTPVDVPTEPGLDAVTDLDVAPDGTLHVAMGSGYGPGGYLLYAMDADGPRLLAEERANAAQLDAFAIGPDGIVAAVVDGDGATSRLIDISFAGATTSRATLPPGGVLDLDVDGAGTAYIIDPNGGQIRLLVVPTDGRQGTFEYVGQSTPRSLALDADGTLWVGDDDLGLAAITEVGVAFPAGPPAGPPPATPVPGSPSFTG